MNQLQKELSVQNWLKDELMKAKLELQSQKGFYDALSATHDLNQAVIDEFNTKIGKCEYRILWLNTQIESIKESWEVE
jgi:hypothetical protein